MTEYPEYDPLDGQEQETIFESNNISDCLDYAKDCKDFEPLECAILNQVTIIEKAVSELQFCIDCSTQNSLVKNRLQILKNLLTSNQKK